MASRRASASEWDMLSTSGASRGLSTAGGSASRRTSMVSSVQRSSLGSLPSLAPARRADTPKIDKIHFDPKTGKLTEVEMHRDLVNDRPGMAERTVPKRENMRVSLVEGNHTSGLPGELESSVELELDSNNAVALPETICEEPLSDSVSDDDSYDGPICEPVREEFNVDIGDPVSDDETLEMLGRKMRGPPPPECANKPRPTFGPVPPPLSPPL